MKPEQKRDLHEIDVRLGKLSEHFVDEEPYLAFLTFKEADQGESMLLSGNSQGLIRLASFLVDLASRARRYQHYHFGEDSGLDEADRELIIRYEPAEWDDGDAEQSPV